MRKRIINLLSLFLAIMGILLSVYLFEKARSEREPTFIVEPIKTEILSSSNAYRAPIQIYTLDGKKIKGDLTSLTFYFWNKGREPIKKGDLLKKVLFYLDSDSKIIDYKLLKTSREVCNIQLDKNDDDSIELNFDILEQDDGFAAQLIFEGRKTTNLNLSATIIGVKEVSRFAISNIKLLRNTLLNIGLGLLALVVVSLMFMFLGPSYNDSHRITSGLKDSQRYLEDIEYKENVDKIQVAEKVIEEANTAIYKKVYKAPSQEEITKKELKKKNLIKAGIIVGIAIVICLFIAVWFATQAEIAENPSFYIPDTIKITQPENRWKFLEFFYNFNRTIDSLEK